MLEHVSSQFSFCITLHFQFVLLDETFMRLVENGVSLQRDPGTLAAQPLGRQPRTVLSGEIAA